MKSSSDPIIGIFSRKRISADTQAIFGVKEEKQYEPNTLLGEAEPPCPRVVIPLIDVYSCCRGYAYRTDYAKCLYGKRNTVRPTEILYGLHAARPHIEEREYALIVEGPFDMLRVYDVGIKNVVSTMGAALSWEQMCLLGRFCQTVFICYDNDEAGREATNKAVTTLTKGGLLPVPVTLDQDPDDYVNAYGAQKLLETCFQSLQSIDPSLSIRL